MDSLAVFAADAVVSITQVTFLGGETKKIIGGDSERWSLLFTSSNQGAGVTAQVWPDAGFVAGNGITIPPQGLLIKWSDLPTLPCLDWWGWCSNNTVISMIAVRWRG